MVNRPIGRTIEGTRTPAFRGILAGLKGRAAPKSKELPIRTHVEAALGWIRHAHSAAGDGGISKGYSLLRGAWAPSYPETTGFTIPTILNAANFLDDAGLQPFALSLADYLVSKLTTEGGVAHFRSAPSRAPIVFDSGQVILGLLAAFEASGNELYLDSAIRAGDWIVSVQDKSGSWKSHQFQDFEKVIDTRVAWALLRLFECKGDRAYKDSAIRHIDWARSKQDTDGWFKQCALVEGEDPVTHTIAYATEGLLECGRLLDDAVLVDTARLTADALLSKQRIDGSLPSAFASGWQITNNSSCLTGNCQVAHLWLKLNELSTDRAYVSAAAKAIRFVACTQDLSIKDANIRGGIAGSFPIYGRYERLKYPNWAPKFFIDAVIACEYADSPATRTKYVG